MHSSLGIHENIEVWSSPLSDIATILIVGHTPGSELHLLPTLDSDDDELQVGDVRLLVLHHHELDVSVGWACPGDDVMVADTIQKLPHL